MEIYLFILLFKKKRFLFDFYIYNIYHIYTTNYFSSEHVLLNFSVKLILYLFSVLNTKNMFFIVNTNKHTFLFYFIFEIYIFSPMD